MEMILLTAAAAADILAAALGLGAAGIKLPPLSAAAAAFMGAAAMCVTALLSAGADRLFPIDGIGYIPKFILLLMGLYSVFGERISALRKKKDTKKTSGHYSFAEAVNHPAVSDVDGSRVISVGEGAALGLALSGDAVLMGISAGLAGMSPRRLFILSLLIGTFFSLIGVRLGALISGKAGKLPAGVVSGCILIILSVIL